jgi:hypothetical protein
VELMGVGRLWSRTCRGLVWLGTSSSNSPRSFFFIPFLVYFIRLVGWSVVGGRLADWPIGFCPLMLHLRDKKREKQYETKEEKKSSREFVSIRFRVARSGFRHMQVQAGHEESPGKIFCLTQLLIPSELTRGGKKAVISSPHRCVGLNHLASSLCSNPIPSHIQLSAVRDIPTTSEFSGKKERVIELSNPTT